MQHPMHRKIEQSMWYMIHMVINKVNKHIMKCQSN